MPLRLRPFLSYCLLALATVLSLFIGPASGQSLGNSIDSLQMMQGLSPEQREAIARQLGGVGAGGLGGTQGTLGGRQQQGDEEQQNLMRQQQRELLMDVQKQRAEMERLSRFLQREDWVVITIDSKPLPVGTQTPAAPQALAALTNLKPEALAAAAMSAGVTAGGYVGPLPPLPNADEVRNEPIYLIRSKNPYQLSRDGMLVLPGFAPIPLAGLTEQLATLRLGGEPALRGLYIRVTKLPLNKVGPTALKPFGYDLFDRLISTFAPATNVPVPPDYVVGPGDELDVQLYGNKNANLQLLVGRDGRVNFPELGPISVGGQTFNSMK